MRHGKKLAKLGRPADQRKALLRSLTTELLRHGKIKTTKVSFTTQESDFAGACQPLVFSCELPLQIKAKAMRKPVDKMITLAKDGSLHARRQVCLGLVVQL